MSSPAWLRVFILCGTIAVLCVLPGCSGGPGDGDLYRFRPGGDTIQVLGVGRIGELKERFPVYFRAESLRVAVGKTLAHIDSQSALLGGRYPVVRDSLQNLELQYRAQGVLYDPSISEYTECCSFRQYGHFIILPVSDFLSDYEKIR